eukprot:COSAG05_NODE_5782_length_1090_cov_0.762866_1_plen_286_part_01
MSTTLNSAHPEKVTDYPQPNMILATMLTSVAIASPLPVPMGRQQFERDAAQAALRAAAVSDPPPECEAKGSCNAGVYFDELVCRLNPKVNATTFEAFKWEIQGLWQPYCAINRGIFVMQPGNPGWENHTYSCGTLPPDWGITNIGALVNAPVETALKALDLYIQAVFNSSDPIIGDTCDFHGLAYLQCNNTGPGVASMDRDDPWQTAPWAHLLYSKGKPAVTPLRSVNIGGLFVLEPWITPDLGGDSIKWSDEVRDQYTFSQQPGAEAILTKHWTTWYTDQDFKDM